MKGYRILDVSNRYSMVRFCSTRTVIHPGMAPFIPFTVSPGIYEVLSILGKERSIKRIDAALESYHA